MNNLVNSNYNFMNITTTLKRITKFAWVNFFRNSGLSFVSVFTIFTTVFLISSIFIVKDVTNVIIEGVEDKISIGVYFKEGIAEENILQTKEEISKIEGVREVEYTSKEQALESFIKKHKENLTLMASLAEVENPFPASINIKAENTEDYKIINETILDGSFVEMFDKVDYDSRKSVIESVGVISSNISKALMIISIVLAIISILIVFNTIRLAIYGMKDEIEIMKLVGVSQRFIGGSFVLQGIIVGLIAAFFGLIIITIIVFALKEKMITFIPGFNFIQYFKENLEIIIGTQLISGLVLGIISSFTATKKYLR